MTVLVTGATGDLGGRLVARLLAEGHSVRVLTRRPFMAHTHFGDKVAIHEWHPGVEPVPLEALDGIETVIHLMGAPLGGTQCTQAANRAGETRTKATARLAEGFGGRRWRLIAASVVVASDDAGAISSDANQETVTALRLSGRPPKPLLAKAMRAAEREAEAAGAAGASVAIVRLGLLLSPGGTLDRLVRLVVAGFKPNLGSSLIPVISPDDAAAMLAGLVSRPDIQGIIHGVAPEPLAGADLSALLAKVAQLPIRLPAPRMLVQRRVGLLAPLLYNRSRIVPQRLMDIGAGFQHPDPRECTAVAIAAILAARPERMAWRPARKVAST